MNNITEMKETMSSLEISKLTGKRHDNVVRDIENVLSEVGIDVLKFEDISKDTMNRDRKVYRLPKRECDLVVSGYVAEYRLAIIDRWQELENAKPQLSQLEMLAQGFAKMAEIENQQKITNERLTAVEERQDNMNGDTQYMTVLAFLRSIKQDAPKSLANALGRKCAAYCKKRGHAIGTVPDERWGSVNSYPLFVLEGYWSKRK